MNSALDTDQKEIPALPLATHQVRDLRGPWTGDDERREERVRRPFAWMIYGARMETPDKKKRPPPYSYRPPARLREEFERRVEESGLSMSAFITKHCLGEVLPSQHRSQPEKKKELARLLREAARIKESLDELKARHPAPDSLTETVEQAKSELVLIRTLIMQALGRKS